jgi:hypothetical protein
MNDRELLAEIKKRAKECNHADDACDLVYFINNTVGANAPWRSWSCEKHHYGGHGPENQCPRCAEERKKR